MGYRTLDKPPKPEDMLRRFDVRNGAIMRIAFACYYAEKGHNPHYHDYKNWPTWNYHPGAICQMMPPRTPFKWMPWPLNRKSLKLTPIDLAEEGYTDFVVSYEDEELASNLDTTAWLDEEDTSIVRMSVNAHFPTFSDKPKEARFTIFAKKQDGTAIDAICHGIVTILPGSPYPTEGGA